jgi:hypothetical protein
MFLAPRILSTSFTYDSISYEWDRLGISILGQKKEDRVSISNIVVFRSR